MSFDREIWPAIPYVWRGVTNSILAGLVRFVPKGDDSKILIGEPADSSVDVGAAVRKGEDVLVKVYSGKSVLDAGSPTGETAVIGRVLSPLARGEVGTIRCIGLNVSWASETPSNPDARTLCSLLSRVIVQEARRGGQDDHPRDPHRLPVRPRIHPPSSSAPLLI
jgi:hypothetical protein